MAKTVYFIEVLKQGRPVGNNTLVVTQKKARFDSAGNNIEGEKTDMIGSDGQGLYTIVGNHANYAARVAALKAKMERDNKGAIPTLIGPFDTATEAFEKMHAVREKSDTEAKAIAEAKLEGAEKENAELSDELSELKAKLAAAEKKTGTGK